MKVLCIADHEDNRIWSSWDAAGRRFEGVGLILSAGDLAPAYLEYMVTMLNVPCLYVRGNHDSFYHEKPPLGCICIEDKAVLIREDPETGRAVITENSPGSCLKRLLKKCMCSAAESTDDAAARGAILVAGLGGSMRYREGRDMYTEKEMAQRVRRLERSMEPFAEKTTGILLTHAPCLGYGDMEDLPHRGFACFNDLLERWRPAYHCYGHVHMEYARIRRVLEHPSGTQLINVSGMYLLDI